MTEHKGTSFYNSCVKVPVDPYSRQPTPSYERSGLKKTNKYNTVEKKYKLNSTNSDESIKNSLISSPRDITESFLEFLESIPDYGQVNHLSNEQFKQKLDYLKRKQKLLLKDLESSIDEHKDENTSRLPISKLSQKCKNKSKNDINDLKLNGKKFYLEESRTSSPVLFPSSKSAGLVEDQDLLINRCEEKDNKESDEKVCLANKGWDAWVKSKDSDNMDSDIDSAETRSLPASTAKEWHPTVPKPFNFTLREEAEKYMTQSEMENFECKKVGNSKRSSYRKRHTRPIPITSKIPLYNKLLAEKEERSRMIREESAFNLMSQVRPFRLECDRRAWRSLARSSPEICSRSVCTSAKFKAKPVPKNLFSTEIYDRMLEDEYYRYLQKKIRAAELMKSSSLPPSMERRERVKSACTSLQGIAKDEKDDMDSRNSSELSRNNTVPLKRCRSMLSLLPLRGNNLAAILRRQVSREKLEREIRERMEEKRREQAVKLKESLIGRNPVWRALRSAARHEHERDLSIRSALRRDEAREQAERHRVQMEMMLDRVTQIPTLFERHSQSYQSLVKKQQKIGSSTSQRKKKKKQAKQMLSNTDSCIDYDYISRPNSGSVTSSSGTLLSSSQSSKSSDALTLNVSDKSMVKSQIAFSKKKGDRSQLKVSINETAELIEDQNSRDILSNDEKEQ